MVDPFEALRLSVEPRQPDPVFSAGLRARVERAFDLPTGVTVSDLTLATQRTFRPNPEPPLRQTITPYLAVADARRAIEWYEDALGGRLLDEPVVMSDGRIGHAEIELAGGRLMLSDEFPAIGVAAPVAGQGVSVTIHLSVDDVDSVIHRAVSHGAVLEREPADYPYGRNGVVRDPFGHRWLVSSEPSSPTPRLHHGDVGYASLWVGDAERAARFFASALGWQIEPNDGRWGFAVQGLTLPHGIDPGHQEPTLFLCYAVSDIQLALDAVRSAGGTAEDPMDEPWGPTAMCTDNQGLAFAVFEPPGGVAVGDSSRPEDNHAGDLAYITMNVVDSTTAREFYSAVLGWRWHPGRVEDGWGVEATVPMTGLSGGHDRSFVMPMYRVQDIAGAVVRVRQAGGSATDPEMQPYGVTAECSDDQGTRFYLGQL